MNNLQKANAIMTTISYDINRMPEQELNDILNAKAAYLIFDYLYKIVVYNPDITFGDFLYDYIVDMEKFDEQYLKASKTLTPEDIYKVFYDYGVSFARAVCKKSEQNKIVQ